MISGAVSSILGLFIGGPPSTKKIIEDAFKEQKKFIEAEFAKQTKQMKEFITESEVESVKAKAMGVLDALDSRYAFILSYEGISSCLDEEVINEVTHRVEYFMDQGDAASVKHTFNTFCVEKLHSAEASNSLKPCVLLLYVYLVIEKKRNEMLTLMLNTLSNSEEYMELSYGYVAVQAQQKTELSDWLENLFGTDTDTYCGIFVYHRNIWYGNEENHQETISLIKQMAPGLEFSADNCQQLGMLNRL